MTVKQSSDVSSSAIQVAVWPEAFAPHCEVHSAPAGANVAELVALACSQGTLDLQDAPRARLFIDGEELDLRESLDVIPAAGSVVNLNVSVHGSSARTFTQLFYAIGSVVVTFMFGPIWGAVVAMAGQVVDRLLFGGAPDSLSANSSGALSDTSNNYRRRESFPLVLGKQRVGFDVAALPYTENVGSDVWLHLVFGVHFGPCEIADLKLGETLLSDYPASDYQIEIRNRPGPRDLTLYPGRVHQDNFNIELDFTGGGVWEVQTLQVGAVSGQIDITLPQGLNFRNDKGKIRNEEVRGRIELAEVGSEAWAPAPIGTYRDKDNHVLPAGDWYVNSRTADPVRLTFPFALDPSKQWKARVKAWDMDGDFPSEDAHTWATYWTAIRSYQPGKPIVDENLSVIAMRIKSSGDLNGSLPLFSGVVEPVVPVYVDGEWLDDPADHQPSSNAAALARWLCTGPAASRPLLTSEINASFGAGYELIEEREWFGSIDVRENEVTLADVIQALGRMGRFNCYWNGSELCLVSDWEKPVPRQLFTGKNAESYRYRRTFRKPPHGVFVEFKDLDAESETAELVVYADGYDATNAEDFAALRLDFACKGERAYREARVYLAKLIHQAESHEWTAGIESIISAYGDRVLVRHATALYGRAEARVRNRHMAGSLVAGFRLSDPVVIEAGKTYAVDIQRDDQLIRGVEVTALLTGLQRDLYFSAPVVPSQAPRAGDLIAFGELGFVTEDLEIVDIQPDGPIATISAVRYAAAEIEAAETGPVPPVPNLLTPRASAPRPRLLGEVTASPDGVILAFDIDPLRAGNVSGFVGRYRLSPTNADDAAPWIAAPPLDAAARTFRTPSFPEAQSAPGDTDARFLVDIELRSVLRNGDRSEALTLVNIPIRRPVPVPVDFFAQGVVRTGPDGSSYSALYVGCDALDAGIVQTLQVEIAPDSGAGPDPEAWRAPGEGLPAANPAGDFRAVDGGAFYAVRGRWLTADQWPGAWVILSGPGRVQVPSNGNVASDTINVGGKTAAQVVSELDDLFAAYGDTIAAEASAAAAEASAVAADFAKGLAQDALASSIEQAGLASGYASASATYRDEASGFASASQGYAVAASASAVQTMPGTFEGNPAKLFTASTEIFDNPPDFPPNDSSKGFASGTPRGTVIYSNGVPINAGPKGRVELRPGRRHRMSLNGILYADGPNAHRWVTGFRVFNATGTHLGDAFTEFAPVVTTADGWTSCGASSWLTTEQILATYPTGASLRPFALLGWSAATAGFSGASWHVDSLRYQDVTESADAAGFATSSAASASTASAKATDAGTFAAAAETARIAAQTANSQAGIARDAAVAAQDGAAGSQAAAAQSVTLAARVGIGGGTYVNAAPSFAGGNVGASGGYLGLPSGWADWIGGAGFTSVAGQVSDRAVRYVVPAGEQRGLQAATAYNDPAGSKTIKGVAGPGWWVAEFVVTLESGSLLGAGGLLQTGAGGVYSGIEDKNFNFSTMPDSTGAVVGEGSPGKTYSFASLFKLNVAATDTFVFYMMPTWTGLYGTPPAKTIIYHLAGLRRATAGEIETGIARAGYSSVSARISAEESVRASETAALATRVSNTEARATALPNLLRNSDFSLGLRYWTSAGSLWTTFYDGAYGSLAGALGGGAGPYYLISDLVSVYGNSTYTISFAGDAPAGVGLYCSQYDAGQNYIAAGDGLGLVGVEGATWTTRKSTTFVTRSDCAFIKVVVSKPAGGNAFISRIMLNTGATVAGWTDAATTRDLAARTSITESSVADAQAKLAVARLVLLAEATGGRPARMTLYSDNYGGSAIALDAAKIYFGDNSVFDDATDTLQTVWGTTRKVMAWGSPFGPDSLTEWEGDYTVALSAMSKANARVWRNGVAPYMGGTAFAGTAPTFQASAPTVRVKTQVGGSTTVTTAAVAITGSGATGSVTYTWTNTFGDPSMTANYSDGSSATFSAVIGGVGRVQTIWTWTATDSGTGITRTGQTYVTIQRDA